MSYDFGFEGFTRMWTDFYSGNLSKDELLSAPGVQFNCLREHLFPSQSVIDAIGPDTLPMEATWVDGMSSQYTTRVPRAIVPSAIVDKFEQFLTIVKTLEKRKVLTYRVLTDERWVDCERPGAKSWNTTIERYRRSWGKVTPLLSGDVLLWGEHVAKVLGYHMGVGGDGGPHPVHCLRFQVRWRGDDGDITRWVDQDEVAPWLPPG